MNYRLSDPVEIKEGSIAVRCGEGGEEMEKTLELRCR